MNFWRPQGPTSRATAVARTRNRMDQIFMSQKRQKMRRLQLGGPHTSMRRLWKSLAFRTRSGTNKQAIQTAPHARGMTSWSKQPAMSPATIARRRQRVAPRSRARPRPTKLVCLGLPERLAQRRGVLKEPKQVETIWLTIKFDSETSLAACLAVYGIEATIAG